MKKLWKPLGLLALFALLLAACGGNTAPEIERIVVSTMTAPAVTVELVEVTRVVEVEVTRIVTATETEEVATETEVEIPCPEIGTSIILLEETQAWAAPIGSSGGTPWMDHVSPRRDGNLPAGSQIEVTECGFNGNEYEKNWWVIKFGNEFLWVKATENTTPAPAETEEEVEASAPTEEPSPTPPPTTAEDACPQFVWSTGAKLFSAPQSGTETSDAPIPYGTKVEVHGCERTWYQTLIGDQERWISVGFTSLTEPDPYGEGSTPTGTTTPTPGGEATDLREAFFWTNEASKTCVLGGGYEIEVLLLVPNEYGGISTLKVGGKEISFPTYLGFETLNDEQMDKYSVTVWTDSGDIVENMESDGLAFSNLYIGGKKLHVLAPTCP